MDSNLIQIARECGALQFRLDEISYCEKGSVVMEKSQLEQFARRIRAAALRDGAESISKLPEAYNADYATVKVCASVLRNMAAAAEDRDGDK